MKNLSLYNHDLLPTVGLGLWKTPKSDAAKTVHDAIKIGYRHLDSACDYGNEVEVGNGIKLALSKGLCKRDELWVTSKLWNTYHKKEHVRPALERTLKDLQIDRIDLYLIHFPIAQEFVPFDVRYPPEWLYEPSGENPKIKFANVSIQETWGAMEQLVRDGLVRNIGICNFGTSMLRDLLTYAEIHPSVLQVERHPYLAQPQLLKFCQSNDITLTGFSPLGAGSYLELGMAKPEDSVLDETLVSEIAGSHGKTPAQIVLRWGIQQGTSVIPKSTRQERLRENLEVFDFVLSDIEMASMNKLDRNHRFNDPGVFAEKAFNTFCPIYE